jgi:hypothetical protein
VTATTTRPHRSDAAVLRLDPGRSPRDWRRYWAAVLPRSTTFRHPRAVLLDSWAAALLHLETWATWTIEHPEDDDPLATEPVR